MTITFPDDVYVAGNLQSQTMGIPANSVTDAQVAPGAAINTLKLMHRHVINVPVPWTALSATPLAVPVYFCVGSQAAIQSIRFFIAEALPDGASISVDIQVVGVSILAEPLSFDSATAAMSDLVPVLSATLLERGQILRIFFTATGAALATPLDVLVQAELDETL